MSTKTKNLLLALLIAFLAVIAWLAYQVLMGLSADKRTLANYFATFTALLTNAPATVWACIMSLFGGPAAPTTDQIVSDAVAAFNLTPQATAQITAAAGAAAAGVPGLGEISTSGLLNPDGTLAIPGGQ